jgi:hypothetical protein
MKDNLTVGHCSQLTYGNTTISKINCNGVDFVPATTHILDKIIKDIDDFRNEYSEDVNYKIDKLSEIIHELVIILKYK